MVYIWAKNTNADVQAYINLGLISLSQTKIIVLQVVRFLDQIDQKGGVGEQFMSESILRQHCYFQFQ